MPRLPFQTFLKHTRTHLSNPSTARATFVVGNTSADLDSITSALLLSYFRTSAPPPDAWSRVYVPVLNIPRGDIGLRPELTRLFARIGLPGRVADDLVTLDDLRTGEGADEGEDGEEGRADKGDLGMTLQPVDTRWILVDHNALLGELGRVYGAQVSGVIDHHEEEDSVPEDTAPEPRIVKPCGSCTSLVVQYCRQTWDKLAKDPEVEAEDLGKQMKTEELDSQLAQLALASILIDTTNLGDESKTTEIDREAVTYLVAWIKKALPDFDREHFFKDIDAAKKDISPLSLRDILRKDYKEWNCERPNSESSVGLKLGMSSVVRGISFLEAKSREEASSNSKHSQSDKTDPLIDAISSYTQSQKLDLHATMTAYASPSGEFKRELLLYAANPQAQEVAERFVAANAEELGLKEIKEGDKRAIRDEGIGEGAWVKLWDQGETKHSRKKVAPMLRRAAEDKAKL